MVQSIEIEIESVKGLREDLCVVQSALGWYGDSTSESRIRRIQNILDQLDVMRPLGPDGKHGDRHTKNCGCELYDVASTHPTLYTPTQEIDIMDRIISGLPIEYTKPANPEGNATYVKKEIVILQPKGIPTFHEATNTWERVPNFDNYEVNCLAEVRNRFTRRILDFEKDVNGKYVEMHDKDGFTHLVSVDHIVNEVFG